MIVRRAEPHELEAVAALYEKVLRETFTWVPAETHRASDFLDDALQEEVYVAVEDGRLLGLASLYRPEHFLHSLYVEARGRGVGKALLDHIAALSDQPLSLKVQAKNARALAFYRREGFQIVEQLPGDPPSFRLRR